MKQQKAMLIALIVICLTVIVTALVTRERPLRVRIRTGQTEVAVFTAYEPEVRDQAENPSPPLMSGILNAPAQPFGGFVFHQHSGLQFAHQPEQLAPALARDNHWRTCKLHNSDNSAVFASRRGRCFHAFKSPAGTSIPHALKNRPNGSFSVTAGADTRLKKPLA